MNADDLIESLMRDVKPVGRHPVGRRVIAGVFAGGLVTLIAVGAGLGFRHDLWSAIHGAAFWIKWSYTVSLALCALAATVRLARPGADRLGWFWIIGLPVAGLAIVAAVQMARTAPSSWLAMWLGGSWKVCSLLVFLLSLPVGVGLLWSFRQLAPTRLRLAGAAAGLTAGAWSATLYCLHCPEVSAIFVLTWYTLGIAVSTAMGAILGSRLLRW
jgi:hypothetical protein